MDSFRNVSTLEGNYDTQLQEHSRLGFCLGRAHIMHSVQFDTEQIDPPCMTRAHRSEAYIERKSDAIDQLRIYNGTNGRMILLGVSGPKCILCSPLFFSSSGRGFEKDEYSAIAGNVPDTCTLKDSPSSKSTPMDQIPISSFTTSPGVIFSSTSCGWKGN